MTVDPFWRPLRDSDAWRTSGAGRTRTSFPEEHQQTVRSCRYLWISHGYPDHLHFPSLESLRGKEILVPITSGNRIARPLVERGFEVRIVPDATWTSLFDRIGIAVDLELPAGRGIVHRRRRCAGHRTQTTRRRIHPQDRSEFPSGASCEAHGVWRGRHVQLFRTTRGGASGLPAAGKKPFEAGVACPAAPTRPRSEPNRCVRSSVHPGRGLHGAYEGHQRSLRPRLSVEFRRSEPKREFSRPQSHQNPKREPSQVITSRAYRA